MCSTKEVISIIELKYLPRGNPIYKKEIRNFDFIARNRKSISIANDRYSGPIGEAKIYGLSNRILFVWAGIHQECRNETEYMFNEGFTNLSECYLQLHAATRKDSDPNIYYYE